MFKVSVYSDEGGVASGYVVEGEGVLFPFANHSDYSHALTCKLILEAKDKYAWMDPKEAELYFVKYVGYILFDDNLNVVEEVYETIH